MAMWWPEVALFKIASGVKGSWPSSKEFPPLAHTPRIAPCQKDSPICKPNCKPITWHRTVSGITDRHGVDKIGQLEGTLSYCFGGSSLQESHCHTPRQSNCGAAHPLPQYLRGFRRGIVTHAAHGLRYFALWIAQNFRHIA